MLKLGTSSPALSKCTGPRPLFFYFHIEATATAGKCPWDSTGPGQSSRAHPLRFAPDDSHIGIGACQVGAFPVASIS